MKKFTAEKGFTLLEMLISLALVSLTMILVVSLFSGGMRVWQRSECGARQEQGMTVALDKMRRELHQIQPFRPIPLRGRHDAVEFPVALDSQESGRSVYEPGRKIFFFDSQAQTLCENEQLYRGMRRSRNERVCGAVLLDHVEKVQFSYLSYNARSKSFSWLSRWNESSLPVSIKIDYQYEDVCREQKSKKQFTISIPIGPIG